MHPLSYMYTMEYYSTIIKENSAICRDMDGPRDCHTECRETQKDKYHMVSPVRRIYKNGRNEFLYKTERVTDVENKPTNLWL